MIMNELQMQCSDRLVEFYDSLSSNLSYLGSQPVHIRYVPHTLEFYLFGADDYITSA